METNPILVLIVVTVAATVAAIRTSSSMLRDLANYCESRAAGLDAYQEAFNSTRVKKGRVNA